MAHVNCKFLHLAFKIVSSAIIFIFSLERSENSQLQIPNQQRTVQHLLKSARKPKYNHTLPLCKKIGETIDKMELVYVLQEDPRN